MWRLFMMTTFPKGRTKGIRAIARKTLLGKVWQKRYALARVKYKNKYKINMFYIYLCVILFFIYVLFWCNLFLKGCFLKVYFCPNL